MAKKSEKVILKDFRDSVYYDTYSKVLDNHCIKIINSVMQEQSNEVKYSWNDVMKEVFKFINTDLREFKDSIDVNPNREQLEAKEMNDLVKEYYKNYL